MVSFNCKVPFKKLKSLFIKGFNLDKNHSKISLVFLLFSANKRYKLDEICHILSLTQ
jgi:hypothetical protein